MIIASIGDLLYLPTFKCSEELKYYVNIELGIVHGALTPRAGGIEARSRISKDSLVGRSPKICSKASDPQRPACNVTQKLCRSRDKQQVPENAPHVMFAKMGKNADHIGWRLTYLNYIKSTSNYYF